MNFPPQLQQNIEKWANNQGISTEEFVLQAVTEKINALSQAEEYIEQNSQPTNVVSSSQTKVYRKEGILVVDAKLPENFDLNTFIDDLREERISNQRGSCSPDPELIGKDNHWQSLMDSLDNFSDDFMATRDQPLIDTK